MRELGTVIASLEGPTTQALDFVVTSPEVRRGQFVCCNTELGTTVALITDLQRANRYFERAESVSAYEKNGGKSIFAELPTSEWEYVIARCRVFGAWGERGLTRSTFPAAPGAKVIEAGAELLKKFLQLDDKGLELGVIEQHQLPARISLTGLLNKHLGLLGLSGSGKSNAASVLIEELLDRKREAGRLAVVVFDVHGEYACFGDRRRNPDYADKTTVVNARQLQIAFHKIKPGLLAEISPDMSATQVRELAKIISAMKKAMAVGEKAYGLKDVMQAVAVSPLKENVKAPLLAWLGSLRGLKLFGRADYPDVKEFVKPGRLVVFDLSQITSQKKKQVIVAYFAKKLFALRQNQKIPPVLLLVEEAHNFAREKAAKGSAVSKYIIETIAREGRKFGACLCLVSQRPVQLSTTALSQLNSFLIFRITNPYDLDHIQRSCEAIDSDVSRQITTLRVGEGILFGEAVSHPLFLQVRERRTHKGGHSMPLEEMAKKFEEHAPREITAEDVEAFV